MAALSKANAIAAWKAAVDRLEETRLFGAVNGTNFIGLRNTQLSGATGDYGEQIQADVRDASARLASLMSPAFVRQALAGPLNEVMRAIGRPERDDVPSMVAGWSDYARRISAGDITGISKASPGVVTSAGHGLSDGDLVYISGVVGMTEVNDTLFKVASAATNTFALNTPGGSGVDTSSYTTYSSGGVWEKQDLLDSRDLTYGSPSYGAGRQGNGALHTLTVDEHGYDLEACHAETKTFECVEDQSTLGERHVEVFSVRGEEAEPDLLSVAGSGLFLPAGLTAVSVIDSARYLVNPSFSQFTGTAPTAGSPSTPTAVGQITGWTLDAVTGVTVDLDTVYRDRTNETRKYAVFFSQDRSITQTLLAERAARLDPGTPVYVRVAVYRGNSADGTLTLTFGSRSWTLAIGSQSDDAWTEWVVTVDKLRWPANFVTDNMTFKLALTSNTTGEVGLDDIVIAPFTRIDGLWRVYDGYDEPALRGDIITEQVTDGTPTAGRMHYWSTFRAEVGVNLPNLTGGNESITDP